MSRLVREHYRLYPEDIITIEATTPKVRDQYAHLGFEILQDEFMLGGGKIGRDGLPKKGDEATGTPVYPMIKVSSRRNMGGCVADKICQWPASWDQVTPK